jgi:toxin ParE1/3/4
MPPLPRPVSLIDDAARDLDEIYAHAHLQGQSGQADLLLDRIAEAIRRAAESPQSCPPPKELLNLGARDYRDATVDRYRLIFTVIDDAAFVVLITDGRRDLQSLLERRLLEA